MQIKFIDSIAGIDFSYRMGQIVECDPKQAAYWLSIGVAMAVKEETPLETATQPKTEIETSEPKRGKRK